jgi:formylglycine-generating enzyme required for sulfatase activity
MTMLYIPAGEFTMGSEPEDPCAHLDEQPKHKVYLDPYWIDQTEVTNGQYQLCVKAGSCPEPPVCGVGESTYQDATKSLHPVTCLIWDEATLYCEWIGGRLPTEAQWEKAARGTEEYKYPWGTNFESSKCNSQEGSLDGPQAVGSFSPEGDSPFGLQDMAGNVWEWTRDWYDIEYYGRAPSENPGGPAAGERRSLRGGSWYANDCSVRTSYRYYDVPQGRSPGVGFRCVIVPSQ